MSIARSLALEATMSSPRNTLFALLASVAVLAGGCTVGYSANARARMVAVSPGVWVVEDRPDPVFYSDDYYWRYDNGAWYRSSYYDGGFVAVQGGVVPVHVRTIERPRGYVHYQAPPRARVRVAPPHHHHQHRATVRVRRR
jgi:hypothetical protein